MEEHSGSVAVFAHFGHLRLVLSGIGADLPGAGLSSGVLYRPPQRNRAEAAVHVGDAAHVHELSAAHPGLGGAAGIQRHY